MGNAESNPVKNVDKRTARRDHAPKFAAAIANFRGVHADEAGRPVLEEPPAAAAGEGGPRAARAGRVRVCVRRRPIFAPELKAGEFDVLTCSRSAICVHDGRLHADCRRLFLKHHTFSFDRVFSERETSAEVFADTVEPLLEHCVQRSAPACVLMYGQTGSGKTYTMSALIALAASRLFELLESAGGGGEGFHVSVTYTELAGAGARDMLNGGQEARLMADLSGEVQVVPQLEVPVASAAGLLGLVRYAQALRATAPTGVHDASSRSHAICTVHVRQGGKVGGGGGVSCGSLSLIDLAGSEQRIDTDGHSAARTRESAAINSSLMALKDGIRALSDGQAFSTPAGGRQPLTQLLRPHFTAPDAATLVLATVSPASKDTEHALNTLRHASLMDGRAPPAGAQADILGVAASSHITGGAIVVEELGELDFKNTQARLKVQQAHLQASRPLGPANLGGIGAREGVGTDAERAEAARQEARAAQSAFAKAERGAARALGGAEPEAHASLLAERALLSRGPRLNRFQLERMRARVEALRAHEAEAEAAGGGGGAEEGARQARGGGARWAEDAEAGGGVDGGESPPAIRAGSATHGRRAIASAPSGDGGRAAAADAAGAEGPRHGRRAAGRPPSGARAREEAEEEAGAQWGWAGGRAPSAGRRRVEASAGPDAALGSGGAPSPRDGLAGKLAAARARREAGEAARRESLVRRQGARGAAAPSPGGASGSGGAAGEVARLEGEIRALPAGQLHAQARAGLARQLAARKAAAVRERRRAEAKTRAGGWGEEGGADEGAPDAHMPQRDAQQQQQQQRQRRWPEQPQPLARVSRPFSARDDDELSVAPGEAVRVLADDGESPWVEVASAASGLAGLVPRGCLEGLA